MGETENSFVGLTTQVYCLIDHSSVHLHNKPFCRASHFRLKGRVIRERLYSFPPDGIEGDINVES